MNKDGSCSVVAGQVDGKHVSDYFVAQHDMMLSRMDFTAETPIASSVPEPFGKPSGPGLWHVKGMMLPYYIQHVAHDLLEGGHAATVGQAIQMAVGIVKKWAAGIPVGGERKVGGRVKHPGHIHPDVQAAAAKAIAEWEAKRVRAHAQHAATEARHRSHSHTRSTMNNFPTIGLEQHFDAWGNKIDLSKQIDLAGTHVHGSNGVKQPAQMTQPEMHAHLTQVHSFPAGSHQSLGGMTKLHAQMHARMAKISSPPSAQQHAAAASTNIAPQQHYKQPAAAKMAPQQHAPAVSTSPRSTRSQTPVGVETPGRSTQKAAQAMRVGGGGRFAALQARLISRGHPANEAARLAAFIGRRKYGARRYQNLARAGARRAARAR